MLGFFLKTGSPPTFVFEILGPVSTHPLHLACLLIIYFCFISVSSSPHILIPTATNSAASHYRVPALWQVALLTAPPAGAGPGLPPVYVHQASLSLSVSTPSVLCSTLRRKHESLKDFLSPLPQALDLSR